MKYCDKIDGLRFIAIFLVLIQHFLFFGNSISAGYYGVDLFFVISGFLITGILLKQNNKSFKTNYVNFLGRRTLRIFPIYYITVLIALIIGFENYREQWLYYLSYTINYAIVSKHLPASHFWSLAVEEQFYLFWPLIVLTLKTRIKALLFIMISIIFLGYLQLTFDIFPGVIPYNFLGLFPRMASLALGAMGAVLSLTRQLPAKFFQSKIVEAVVFMILAATLLSTFKLKFLILGWCSLYLVLKSADYGFRFSWVEKFLKNKLVVYIGTLAYGIYIFHPFIAYYFITYVFNDWWQQIDFTKLGIFRKLEYNRWVFQFPVLSVLSVLVAMLSYKFIEAPILKLKDKYFK